MNWKRLAGISLLLNAAVLALLFANGRKPDVGRDSRVSGPEGPATGPQSASSPHESPVHKFNWSQIESTNYPEYIANLRSIGCPEQTIRDIVSADVAATLRGIASTDASAPATGAWRENAERLVIELMGGAGFQSTIPSGHDVVSAPDISTGVIAGLDQPSSPVSYVQNGIPNGSTPSVPAIDATSDTSQESVEKIDRAANELPMSPEMARLRWIATYIGTRYGQQAWNDLQQQSAGLGGDIDVLLQQRNISIPDPPQRLLPIVR